MLKYFGLFVVSCFLNGTGMWYLGIPLAAFVGVKSYKYLQLKGHVD